MRMSRRIPAPRPAAFIRSIELPTPGRPSADSHTLLTGGVHWEAGTEVERGVGKRREGIWWATGGTPEASGPLATAQAESTPSTCRSRFSVAATLSRRFCMATCSGGTAGLHVSSVVGDQVSV